MVSAGLGSPPCQQCQQSNSNGKITHSYIVYSVVVFWCCANSTLKSATYRRRRRIFEEMRKVRFFVKQKKYKHRQQPDIAYLHYFLPNTVLVLQQKQKYYNTTDKKLAFFNILPRVVKFLAICDCQLVVINRYLLRSGKRHLQIYLQLVVT